MLLFADYKSTRDTIEKPVIALAGILATISAFFSSFIDLLFGVQF